MRNVLIKRWIPIEYERTAHGHQTRKVGTGQYSKEYEIPGKFHQWGSEVEEGENSVAANTVAIIELSDGTVTTVLPHNFQFIE